jgi:hypothetical protein
MQTLTHYSLHLFFPLAVAWIGYRSDWKRAYFLFLATMLVDLDHLAAQPIFDAHRCSIQYHFLHSYYAMIIYGLFLFLPRPLHYVGLGLLMHMATDLIDCVWTYSNCPQCLANAPAFDLIRWISQIEVFGGN